jgi:hypothetical protein
MGGSRNAEMSDLWDRTGDKSQHSSYRAGFQIAIRMPTPTLHRNRVPRLFHNYVMRCSRGKRILELDLPI